MACTAHARLDALLTTRRRLVADATRLRAAGRPDDAERVEEQVRAIEAWVMVALGLTPREAVERQRAATERSARGRTCTDPGITRAHESWLVGYATGRRLLDGRDAGEEPGNAS